MHRHLAHSLLFLLFAAPVAAQTVQGTVVSLGTHEVRRGAHVALLDDSLHAVNETATDSTLGAFYLDAPRKGRYSLAVYDRFGYPFTSAPFQLDSGAIVQREVAFPAFPPMLDSLPVVSHLTPGPPLRQDVRLRYPETERAAGRTGHVRMAVIVDADGRIVPGSLFVMEATNNAFARSAREAEAFVSFVPASADGRAPRVVTQLTVGFDMGGAPSEHGDIMIRALGIVRQKP